MNKSTEFKLKLACVSTAAYGLNASLDMNVRMCPPPVRSAMRGVVSALGQKGVELMYEQSCKLLKVMDTAFDKKAKIYKMKGFKGDPVRDWYLWLKLFLIDSNQIEDKDMKAWFKTREGKHTLEMVRFTVFHIAEELVEEAEKNDD